MVKCQISLNIQTSLLKIGMNQIELLKYMVGINNRDQTAHEPSLIIIIALSTLSHKQFSHLKLNLTQARRLIFFILLNSGELKIYHAHKY